MVEPIARVLPAEDPEDGEFWTAGADGRLSILRCQSCGYWIHPPTIICPQCLSREVAPETTSGKATLLSYAVSHMPAPLPVPLPYTIILAELPEQEGLRILSNLVNCAPEDAYVGMPLRAVFEQHDEVFVPLFEPDQD